MVTDTMEMTDDELVDALDVVVKAKVQPRLSPQDELLAELAAEEAEAQAKGLVPGEARKDVWTLDTMQKKLPVTGDLYENGEFLFTFKPVLGSTYTQERFAIGRGYKPGTGQDFTKVQVAYSELVYFAMKGCTWPVRETVENEFGETVYEDDGETPKTVPLPITLDAIKRMDIEMLVLFINAMTRATSGEAKGKG